MKDRVDKSMGIVTRIVEDLVRIKPTEPFRLTKTEDHQKRNYSDVFLMILLQQNKKRRESGEKMSP